ncbi:hypothetical protein N1495_09255 [Streptococcus didelphis]|uniref:Uncharacterized protein n=1 Tax=Streptococcus didelphis TaxID=102886 RepID=A0ABY9LF45_9STRE|nr:hypothetical protein [Streptococcus didelphis]WMB27567.1 hypothetical protein N1496_04995 [Streptococcus didelphis]WMB29459.1 hypothetical protein N1495_09255 [Streptococcus didelphis]
MSKEDDIIFHYQRERIKLEQKEDELHFISQRAGSMIDDFYSKLCLL